MTGVGAIINTAKAQACRSAAVIGCGGVGLCILLGCKLTGCHPIVAVDVKESKLEFARSLGDTHTINSSEEDPVDVCYSQADKRRSGLCFDSVGASATIAQALQTAAVYGAATVTGMHDILKPVPIPADVLISKIKSFWILCWLQQSTGRRTQAR